MVERSKLLIACETTWLWGKKTKTKPPLLDCEYCLIFLNVSGVIHIPRDRPRVSPDDTLESRISQHTARDLFNLT